VIVPNLFQLPVRVLDGGLITHPIHPNVADGPARFARVESNSDHEVRGQVWVQAPVVTFDNGWVDTLLAMDLVEETDEWNALCRRTRFFDTTMGWLMDYDQTRAWITRDAIGWTTGPHNRVHTTVAEDGTKVWPWLWLRPHTTQHAHLQRVQRFLADVAWMAGCVGRAQRTP
jgi:hypothetical protein